MSGSGSTQQASAAAGVQLVQQQQQQQQVPPGFRFHPTDEELVDYYLRKKVASRRIDLNVIKDVDLYKIEPWDLQEQCRILGPDQEEEQSDWYFFSHKDKKYPTGTRTNRATAAGFWKATGRDKPIYANAKHPQLHCLVGMRKTLVYYKGRAPNGHKSDWIMHEYRLETNENAPPQEEGWVVCRVFKKRLPATRRDIDAHCSSSWYVDDDAPPFMHDLNNSPNITAGTIMLHSHHVHTTMAAMQQHQQQQQQHIQLLNNVNTYKQQMELKLQFQMAPAAADHQHAVRLSNNMNNVLPHHDQLQTMINPTSSFHSLLVSPAAGDHHHHQIDHAHKHVIDHLNIDNDVVAVVDQSATDWRVLDKFVASQLSNDATKGVVDYTDDQGGHILLQLTEKQDQVATDYASTSTSSSQVDHPWK